MGLRSTIILITTLASITFLAIMYKSDAALAAAITADTSVITGIFALEVKNRKEDDAVTDVRFERTSSKGSSEADGTGT